jgi:outer membrane lipoprotein-sorting protein
LPLPKLHCRLVLAAGLVAAALFAGAASAAPPAPLAAEDQASVDKAADYLAALGEAKGRFVQTDPNGAVSQGAVFLERGGRARFVYDPPSNKLMVSDGAHVSVVDPRLKTFDRYPLGSTPLALFLANDVRHDPRVAISRVEHFADGFALTAHAARHPKAGSVTLTFSSAPVRLTEWDLTDAQGGVTRVKIVSLEPTSGLDPSLFVLRDPRADRAGGAAP